MKSSELSQLKPSNGRDTGGERAIIGWRPQKKKKKKSANYNIKNILLKGWPERAFQGTRGVSLWTRKRKNTGGVKKRGQVGIGRQMKSTPYRGWVKMGTSSRETNSGTGMRRKSRGGVGKPKGRIIQVKTEKNNIAHFHSTGERGKGGNAPKKGGRFQKPGKCGRLGKKGGSEKHQVKRRGVEALGQKNS